MSNIKKLEVSTQSTATPGGKKPFLSNLGSIIKKSGQSLKEKISNFMFKNKNSNSAQIQQEGEVLPPQSIEKTKKISEAIPSNSQTKKKEFNIQLSDDGDKENVYHLNDEEEEDDAEFEYIDENENEENKKTNDQQSIENSNTNIQSSTVPVKENFASKHSEEEVNPKKEMPLSEKEVDFNSVCHRIYYKGSVVDIRHIVTHKFIKQKSKSNFFSIIGISNKKSIEKNYLAFFDENYLYFLKDMEVDKENKFLRRIGSKFNFYLLCNVQFDEYESQKWKVLFEYFTSPVLEDTIEKVLYFDQTSAEGFYMMLNEYFKRLKMQLGGNENNNFYREGVNPERNDNNAKGMAGSEEQEKGDDEIEQESENI